MIKKILIANRGEIAVRIIRTCRDMGIETVAVYSEADQDALHVKLADEAYQIGPAIAKDSYLNTANIMTIAMSTGCDAIHPGYGFLAENASFRELCDVCGMSFIGPSANSIALMGTKDVAKATMIEANVPVVPGSVGLLADEADAIQTAQEIGYPVILKATAGGGGKGIRVCENEEELIQGFHLTQMEAEGAFGNPGVYMEKFIQEFRHVEVQILADQQGNTIHLGERDCSIQRRMQKLVEEAPSPAVSDSLRTAMGEAAIRAAKACGYYSAGTVEFIYDENAGKFYFMEMNTRIQVEHPVTEFVTNTDIVREQLQVASGLPLSVTQEDVVLKGWAIECRINAENPKKNFMPNPGKITQYLAPGGIGIRVDSAAYAGYMIPPYYDSMIAKVISYGATREEAINRMSRALSEFVIEGVETTIPFHLALLQHPTFKSGHFNTKFLQLEKIDI